ncbi:hypothetical protein [Yersinia phage vB_YenM_P778]
MCCRLVLFSRISTLPLEQQVEGIEPSSYCLLLPNPLSVEITIDTRSDLCKATRKHCFYQRKLHPHNYL